MSDKPLRIRHHRFVHEYLKDGNATQAYIRAGYSKTGSAQSSASRLLTQPVVAAAVAAGRRRLAHALEVAVEGRIHIDPQRVSHAQRAGIIVLKPRDHSKQESRRPMAQDQERDEARCPACKSALNHNNEEQRLLQRSLPLTVRRLYPDAKVIWEERPRAGRVARPRRSAPPHERP